MKGRFAWKAYAGCLAVGALFFLSVGAIAQTNYSIGEGANSAATPGPVRLARISYQNGTVTWRPSDTVEWSESTNNLPLRQGAELWVKTGSRAEVQFDDGSTMRLGGDGMATLQTLYSDDKGEFTEINMTQGLADFHLTSKLSEYQIDTPLCTVKAYGPADIRIGVSSGVEVVVHSGQAEIDTASGTTTLTKGRRLRLGGPAPSSASSHSSGIGRRVSAAASSKGYSSGSYSPQSNSSQTYSSGPAATTYTSEPPVEDAAPNPDSWDYWCDERDIDCYHENQYVPSCVNVVAGNLDAYGSWHEDPHYGHVWCPRVAVGWRPYHDGEWTWVSPMGWTWVPAEPWGWAPCHYGTWTYESYGWAWCPGPAVQYWSPAVVSFCDDGFGVAWAPLAPFEVRYPAAISIGFAAGDWSLSFSIGQAACYFPTGEYCVPRPWANVFVNRSTNFYNASTISSYYGRSGFGSQNFYGVNNRFRPFNAYRANGASSVSRSSFASGGRIQALSTRQASIFQHGRTFTDLPRGAQVSGPLGLAPRGGSAFTPTHATYAHAIHPVTSVLNRSTFRSRLPNRVASQSAPFHGRTILPSTHAGSFANRSRGIGSFGSTPRNMTRTASTGPVRAASSAAPTRAPLGNRPSTSGRVGMRSSTSSHVASRAKSMSHRVASRGPSAPIHRASSVRVAARGRATSVHRSSPRRVASRRPSGSVRRASSPISHSSPGRVAARPSAPHFSAPRSSEPRLATPRPPAPRSPAPRFSAPRSGPRPSQPRSSAPRSFAPRFSPPGPSQRFSMPHSSPPRFSAPRSSPPRFSAPRSSGQRFSAPRSSPPRSSAPRSSAPRGGGSGRPGH